MLANLLEELFSIRIADLVQSDQPFDSLKAQAALVGELLSPHPESFVQVDEGVVQVKERKPLHADTLTSRPYGRVHDRGV